jgi:hypothetical protein
MKSNIETMGFDRNRLLTTADTGIGPNDNGRLEKIINVIDSIDNEKQINAAARYIALAQRMANSMALDAYCFCFASRLGLLKSEFIHNREWSYLGNAVKASR